MEKLYRVQMNKNGMPNFSTAEEVEPCKDDAIRRSDAIKAVEDGMCTFYDCYVIEKLKEVPSAEPKQGEWIPCEERLPEDLEIVNVTFVNHRPLNRCYEHLKDKPFTATAIYYGNRWWWYSPIFKDLLAEYAKVDVYVEITAWQPLPEPYMKGADDEQ